MQEKIHEYKITQPLTAERRKAILALIKDNAARSPWPIEYAWDKSKTRLLVTSKPMNLEVVFHPTKIEVYRDAPLWARMLITKKKQAQMLEAVVNILKELGFLEGRKPPKAKSAGK